MLIFPAEPSDAGHAGRLKDGHWYGLAVNLAVALPGLRIGDGLQCGIVNGLDETVPQGIEHRPQRSNLLARGEHFLGLWTNGAVVHDGAARDGVGSIVNGDGWVDEVSVRVFVAGADFRDLAGASRHGILVAIGTSGRVVNGTESTIVSFSLLKVLLIEGEGVARWFGDAITYALRSRVLLQQRARQASSRFRLGRLCRSGVRRDSRNCDGCASQQAGKG